MRFSEQLRAEAELIWSRIFAHPVVTGIGDGTLPLEQFRFYIGQDYVYLIEYSRFLALAAARSDSLGGMSGFASLLNATLNTEMTLHRAYAQEFGIAPDELARVEAAPTTYAYTRHLLQVGYAGTPAEIIAALLPCQWGYAEIGQMLARRGEPTRQPLYGQWIRAYASDEFAQLATWLRTMLDDVTEELGPRARRQIRDIFITSSRYEYLFWEMVSERQGWPV